MKRTKTSTVANRCNWCWKGTDPVYNYCSWNCQVEEAKANGGFVHTPNDLPIASIRGDGLMLEHEHGDHPTYMFPVVIEYHGVDRELYEDIDIAPQTHALIYTDGNVALTLYETSYALWRLRDGSHVGGTGFAINSSMWKMTRGSIDKIFNAINDKEPAKDSNR